MQQRQETTPTSESGDREGSSTTRSPSPARPTSSGRRDVQRSEGFVQAEEALVPPESRDGGGTVASGAPYPGVMLRRGSSGRHVMTLQSMLNQRMVAGLVVDGIFGQLTQKAVIAFQNDASLDQDGIVGPRTWTVLAGTNDAPAETRTVEASDGKAMPERDRYALAGATQNVILGLAAVSPSRRGSRAYAPCARSTRAWPPSRP